MISELISSVVVDSDGCAFDCCGISASDNLQDFVEVSNYSVV